MKLPGLIASLTVLAASCSVRSPQNLGTMVDSQVVPIVSVPREQVGSTVAVRGKMTQKCPVAGCWFMLQDGTGTIKVDTKNAGFAVVSLSLNSTLTVAGRVMTNGTERFIDAVGARY